MPYAELNMKHSCISLFEFGPCIKHQNTEVFWQEALVPAEALFFKYAVLQEFTAHVSLSRQRQATGDEMGPCQVCAVRMACTLQTSNRNKATADLPADMEQ